MHVLNLLASLCVAGVQAEQPVLVSSDVYDRGELGRYPVQRFRSVNLIAPRPNLLRQDSRCSKSLLTFLAPHGHAGQATHPQATILDHDGHLVWTSGWDRKQIHNLMAQTYRGHEYITFWAGHKVVGQRGTGAYYMLDETYNMTRRMHAANGLSGDFHEFRLTAQGTALITAYDEENVELSVPGVGGKKVLVADAVFQEINVETGDLVFAWRASEHVNMSDTYLQVGDREDGLDGEAFDWFHMTSVDKDKRGNYLISSRHLHSLFYISGTTGDVIWTMGGKRNQFKDLSDGKATDFAFQHDARWGRGHEEITLLDNGRQDASGPRGPDARPRGIRLRLDEAAMTVELVTEYKTTTPVPAGTWYGSVQNLPNGNVLLGHGHAGLFAEFTRSGEVLCETHFGPQSGFGTGDVQSYRVLKFYFSPGPETQPDMAILQDEAMLWKAYVSWNGDAETSHWVLQGSDDGTDGGAWKTVERRMKTEFETEFALSSDYPVFLRVIALDPWGHWLATSRVADASRVVLDYETEPPAGSVPHKDPCAWCSGVATGLCLVLFAYLFRSALLACFARRRGTVRLDEVGAEKMQF